MDAQQRTRAAELAAQMSAWLAAPCSERAITDVSPELVEWCRSARDALAAVAEGQTEPAELPGAPR